MARFSPLWLLFQACRLCSFLAWADFSDCQDDSSSLQVQATSNRKAVTCDYGEEEFTFDAWGDGVYTTGDEPLSGSGVTISGYTVGPDECKQPAILSRTNTFIYSSRNRDIRDCDCKVLGMANTRSPLQSGRIVRCQPEEGAATIELTFATPRDILSVTFLNVLDNSKYSTTFSYQIDGDDDYSQTVTIPPDLESIVDISENCKPPQNVKKVTLQFGNTVAFKGMKMCQPAPSLVGDSHLGTQHHALHFQGASSIMAKSAATLTCPHGEEEYTFSEWNTGFYSTGDPSGIGIEISGYSVGPDECQKPAIMSPADYDEAASGLNIPIPILNCDCSALIMAKDESTLQMCTPSQGAPRIELTFDVPQDITSVTFVGSVNGPTSGYITTFTYQIDGTDEFQRASHTVRIPQSGAQSLVSTVDLTQECLLPQNVKKVTLEFGNFAVFRGMTLCKGGASLVGDPHVRTQDHAHYTVLNEGNFLAWRFNSHTAFTQKSGAKKLEVDWRIYAHYSAHRRSWTRGLLLVDQSMGSHHQSFEFTSEECMLRKRIGDEWKVMDSSQLSQVSKAGDFVTGFNFTHLEQGKIQFDSKKIWTPKGKKARWDAQFLMATPHGRQLIATVQLRCFPGRHIDVQVIRERMADARFVEGQLGHHGVQLKKEKNGLGHWFHTSSDQEFQLNTSWVDLGGSRQAAAYFELEEKKAKTSLTGNPTCSPEEEKEAMKLCQETMKKSRNADAEVVDECVLDICAGGGAAAAELAGDIFAS